MIYIVLYLVMSFITPDQSALLFAMLWSERNRTCLEDDFSYFQTIQLPESEEFCEAMFELCKAKI